MQAAEALSTGGEKEAGGGGGTTVDDLEYTTLARRTLGKCRPSVVDGSIVLECAGSVCSYIVLIGGLVTSLIVECTGEAIINTSYQKLPFGSGDYPDKRIFHQALN